ncbi:ParB/RepB/Spo0J family partition protein [Tissierella creatinophila]|uniref:Putative chromosome-partitioning protein ParB n=1 Tax=Tissierella creatinophila DSM 6911 TaxID=1123403 RepID=A0A1U7M690_TISCR|nr:ParB/RepB/Spo0J family partition protein [Tissierella creatinophila]OLS02708.1 putative chromosome-partitioning protein ParB [Tissierella creatinophila DSM 6911]
MTTKKRGLGKGLSALLADKPSIDNLINEKDDQREGKIKYISLDNIKAKKDQPRKEFEKSSIKELSNSIKVHGVIQPILLRKKDDMYEIIAGERRFRASKLANLEEIPAIVLDAKDEEVAKLALIENIQREDLNPIEESIAYKNLMEDFNLKQDELAETIGKSRSYITNSLRLLNLDQRVIDYLYNGELTQGHGKVLLGIKDKKAQVELAKRIIETGLNVRSTEEEVKKVKQDKNISTKKKTSNKKDSYIVDLEEQLIRTLGTKVNLTLGDKKGKIEIEYYSDEDLQRIFEILTH